MKVYVNTYTFKESYENSKKGGTFSFEQEKKRTPSGYADSPYLCTDSFARVEV